MLAKRKRTPVLCAEHLTCVQVHECHHPHPSPAAAEHLTCVQVQRASLYPHPSPSVAQHLTCVQVHECHHPHPSPAVAEHLTCVQVHECQHPHPSPAVAEHLTCVQVHECHHPHPTPPPVPLFSCKIHRDHMTVPATNIAPKWMVGSWNTTFHLGRPIFRSYVGVYSTSNISTSWEQSMPYRLRNPKRTYFHTETQHYQEFIRQGAHAWFRFLKVAETFLTWVFWRSVF